jgi:5-methyltetrahydrofolate corrinoid/iron sulfur protein methyltransferase
VIIIGEKINASIPKSKIIIQEHDEKKLVELAREQAAAGADFIDVNVGTGIGSREDEIMSMEWAITTIQREVDTPLCIDSADHVVLEAGIKARDGRPSIINSVKAEEENLKQVVPMAGDHNIPLVALTMDETGIPMSVEGRMRACERIAMTCQKYGVPLESVFFDPLVLPVSTDIKQGGVTLCTIMEIKRKFPAAKTVMGLSNVSYGLPARGRLNVAFLHMAIFAGLDAAITDPLNKDLMDAVKTAEVLAGKDRHCRRYTRAFRN